MKSFTQTWRQEWPTVLTECAFVWKICWV